MCAHIVVLFIPTGAIAFLNAHFGPGAGLTYLNNVHCNGTENNLMECPRQHLVSCSRGHNDAAGVRCQGKFTYACIHGTEYCAFMVSHFSSACLLSSVSV